MHASIPLGSRLAYGLGGFATSLVFGAVATYLVYYHTDVCGIAPEWAGAIFFIARVLDAFLDPVVGVWADRRRRLGHGGYGWFITRGAVPLALSMVSVFAVALVPEWSRLVFAFFTYLIFTTIFTVVYVPYSALTSAMTTSTYQRGGLASFRVVFDALGGLAAATTTKPLVALFANEAEGYAITMGLFSVPATLAYLACARFSREAERGPQGGLQGVSGTLRTVLKNKPFMVLAGALVCGVIASTVFGTMLVYYFEYVLLREDLIPYAFGCLMAPMFIAVPIWLRVAGVIGKRNTYVVGVLGVVAVQFTLCVVRPVEPMANLVLLAVLGFMGASGGFNVWSMLADTVDYGEWQSLQRTEGLLHGWLAFAMKLGMGLAKLIAGLGLAASGYIATQVQTESARQGITLVAMGVPVLFNLSAVAFLTRYTLTYARCEQLRSELDARKAAY